MNTTLFNNDIDIDDNLGNTRLAYNTNINATIEYNTVKDTLATTGCLLVYALNGFTKESLILYFFEGVTILDVVEFDII